MDNTINQQGGVKRARDEQERREEELREERRKAEERQAQEGKEDDRRAGDDRKAGDRVSSDRLQQSDQNLRDELRREDDQRQDQARRDDQHRRDDRRREDAREQDAREAINDKDREGSVNVATLAAYTRSTSQREDRMSEHNGSIEQVTTAQKNVLDPRDLADRPGGGSPRGLTEQEMDLERAHYAQSEENRRVSSSVLKRVVDRSNEHAAKAKAEGRTHPSQTTIEKADYLKDRLDFHEEAHKAKEQAQRRGVDQRQQHARGMSA
jgi:hypothetical protein